MDLSGQVTLVTGAGQGIGKAAALALAAAGADTIVTDINEASANETAAAIAATGRRALAIRADVGNLSEIDRMVSEAVARFGKIDVLVNNAGVTRRAYIMDLTEDDWDRIFRVNVKGVFFCLQRVAREMIPRRSGRIINIASQLGQIGGIEVVHYSASKGGVIAFTKALAREVAARGVLVNAIAPGPIETPMLEGETEEWRNRKLAELCGQYLQKGRLVYVEGRLQTRSWDDKQTGQKKYMTEVVANDLVLLGGRSEGAESSGGYARGAAAGGNNFDQRTPEHEQTSASPITDEDIPF